MHPLERYLLTGNLSISFFDILLFGKTLVYVKGVYHEFVLVFALRIIFGMGNKMVSHFF